MKMTIDLPEPLIKAIKIRAAQEERTVREVVAEYLTNGLYPPATVAVVADKPTELDTAPWGLPIIQSRPDAVPMGLSGAEAIAFLHTVLLDEECERQNRAV